jgi:hypothetical protein
MTELDRWRQLMRCWIRTHDVRALAEVLARMSESDRAAALGEIGEHGGEVLARDIEELLRRRDGQLALL